MNTKRQSPKRQSPKRQQIDFITFDDTHTATWIQNLEKEAKKLENMRNKELGNREVKFTISTIHIFYNVQWWICFQSNYNKRSN